MARKLSNIARRGGLILAATGALTAADFVFAQSDVRVSPPPNVLPNPFARGAAQPKSRSVEPEPPREGPVTYHNPFSSTSAAPPIEMPARPGPVSRWRRPGTALDESPIKAAVLATDSVEHTRIPWDQLPPAESLRERAAARSSRNEILASAAGTQPYPIDFAPQQLTQPEWVAPQRPTDGATTGTVQIASQARDIHDPFDEPGLSGPVMVAARSVIGERQLDDNEQSQKTPATAEALPLIVSEYSESPDGCLAQAQQRAQTAETVDELSGIADLCQRGLASGPPSELALPLRRLAAWAHNRRGELLIDEDRASEAIKDFQVAISLDPGCSLAIHNRAVTLAQQNETAAALRDFNRVIELNPGLAIAYRNRAELLASLGRFNEAVRDYSQAIDGLSDDAELYCARGSAWHRLGEFQRSFDDLNQAIQIDPNNADAFTQRGNLEAERGNFDQAINDFQQAVTIDPNRAEAHRSMAWLQATCPSPTHRNAEQAIAAAEQAAKLSPPDDCFVLDSLAAAHASAGDFDEATRVQQQAVAAAAPDFAEPLRQRLALYRQGQPFISGQGPLVRAASHNARSAAEE